jgi:hypothetical protein
MCSIIDYVLSLEKYDPLVNRDALNALHKSLKVKKVKQTKKTNSDSVKSEPQSGKWR